jgi:malonyl-CoA/methylmalonyl-CoA synthetase
MVVPASGAVLDESSVQKALAKKLAKFKLPKRVFFAAKLPRNTMGKVQKNLLRDRFRDLFAARAET